MPVCGVCVDCVAVAIGRHGKGKAQGEVAVPGPKVGDPIAWTDAQRGDHGVGAAEPIAPLATLVDRLP